MSISCLGGHVCCWHLDDSTIGSPDPPGVLFARPAASVRGDLGAAGKPFFLYLPFSMGHFPNLPSRQFSGKSRIGQYGDKLMEGDYHVGQILDALKELGVDGNTLLVFASDNGPQGETAREMGNQGSPDMGNAGPFRGELGEATEGSIRTFCVVRWPGKVKSTPPPTRCSRRWTSFRSSPASLEARYQPTGRSMASTRPTFCSVRARPATAIAC